MRQINFPVARKFIHPPNCQRQQKEIVFIKSFVDYHSNLAVDIPQCNDARYYLRSSNIRKPFRIIYTMRLGILIVIIYLKKLLIEEIRSVIRPHDDRTLQHL
jgi:hypothetical protein